MLRNGDLILQLYMDMSNKPQMSSHYLQQENVIDLKYKTSKVKFLGMSSPSHNAENRSTNVVSS